MSRIMTRLAMLVAALALVAAPTAIAGHGHHGHHGNHGNGHHKRSFATRLALKQCRAERADIGKQAFREKYGKHAMRKCVRAARPAIREQIKAAATTCRSEREDIGGKAFREKYGRHHALRKCVKAQLAGEPTDS